MRGADKWWFQVRLSPISCYEVSEGHERPDYLDVPAMLILGKNRSFWLI